MDCDVIVVGSGPAGTSAAHELVSAGRRVTLIDAGGPVDRTRAGNLTDASSSAGVRPRRSMNTSPKLRSPDVAWMFEDFARAYDVQTDNFELIGSLAHGGLSNAWGAGVAEWTNELDDWPVEARSTRDWYRAISNRIGVSGPDDDELTPHVSPTMSLQPPVAVGSPANLLVGAAARRRRDASLLIGGVRHAVLTKPIGARQACDSTGTCMTGCPVRAIYTSQMDLETLGSRDSFELRSHTTVVRIGQEGRRPFVEVVLEGTEVHRLFATRVLVAAGPPASTALALAMIGAQDSGAPIQSTPVMAWALLPLTGGLPARFAGGFSMGQGMHLGWPSHEPFFANESVYGGFFNAGALPVSEMMDRLPRVLATIGSPVLTRLWERLVLATAFLPGRFSRNRIRVATIERSSPPAIRISGETGAEARRAYASLKGFYRSRFARVGWLLVPGSVQLAPVGSDVHYGASLPMTDLATRPTLSTDPMGRLALADRIHFVDGSILPTLPGKPHTLTVMANASRIASVLAGWD